MRKILCFALVWSCLAAPRANAGETPTATVSGFHDALLVVMMEADRLGVRGRYQRLEQQVGHAFDLTLMIRIAAGSHWRKAEVSERQRLAEAFRRLSIATYASQFDDFSGQQFVTDGERPGPQRTVLVATRIVSPDGDGADLTYVVKSMDDGWRIVDVLLGNAISQLAVRRSEYSGVLKDGGIETLIRLLDKKTESLLSD